MARESWRARRLRQRQRERAESKDSHKGRNWLIGALTAIGVGVIATILATHIDDWLRHAQPPRVVAGTVTCKSGAHVAGVWVEADSGKKDSGFAHLGAASSGSADMPIGPTAYYSYRLRHGGAYTVKVGCGQIGKDWATNNYSPQLTQSKADLLCVDPPPDPSAADPPKGDCQVQP